MGNLDYFFYFNCLLGTLTTYLISLLVITTSGNIVSGLITALILTFYTEFLVFSSVFYTPVLMLFLLASFIFLVYYYYTSYSKTQLIIIAIALFTVYSLTFC